MQTRQKRLLSALQRVQGFLDTHAALLGAINSSGMRTVLDTAVQQLTTLAETQDPTQFNRKQAQETVRRQRADIRNQWMKPIVKIGGTLPRTEEFRTLRLPNMTIDVIGFISVARAMATVGAAHLDTFTGAGLPADFVTLLTAATDTLEQSVATRDRLKGTRVGATAAIRAVASQGKGAVRVIDALIGPVNFAHSTPASGPTGRARRRC